MFIQEKKHFIMIRLQKFLSSVSLFIITMIIMIISRDKVKSSGRERGDKK